ncbi:gluconeogenesis factor YvcK family protein [Propionivibrio soli]|uniref:gluconeogenesis factor YvcK family protein n=1 Tax=Propionivibrio soli TaxID=2976531 RepID=UPI0021E8AFCB|nr:gluconeogenesis factor YvcK family protein [Propionivibrio soli]
MRSNITTIGGGTGTFNVLSGLSKHARHNLAAIVTVADSGGSTGELRDEFGILPPGDVRRAIVALSEDTEVVRRLFEYRFKVGKRIAGHTIGNLLLTALTDIMGDFELGIEELSEMFNVRGKVIPVTLDNVSLGVTLENGDRIIGETDIDVPKHDANIPIRDVFLLGGGRLNPRAKEAIENSDYVIVGPGDLYTSIVPNLLCHGMFDAIRNTKAKIVYVCNIMTKHGETDGFAVEDFVRILEQYLGEGTLDYVLVNNGELRADLLEKYESEGKVPVRLRDRDGLQQKGIKVVERDFTSATDYIRHDPRKLARTIEDFASGWIK